jgi:tetratricopeptide (TPR) repeat protein
MDNSPMYLNMAGTTYIELGLPREAFNLYNRAVELQPKIQLFKENLASCATFVGELSLATQLYEELLANDPNHQRNLYQLSRLIKAKDETLIERIATSIAEQPEEHSKNIFGYYALAKQYEDIGEFQRAFDQLELGAKAISSVMDYDPSVDRDILIAARANSRPVERVVASSAKKAAGSPIFVIGLPRTGTTLLEQMLAAHPEIESLGETNTIEAGILALSGNLGKPMSASILEQASNISPRAIKNYYLEATRYRRKGLPFFIEKMPTNYQYLHLIIQSFPEAKILILNRHPIDTCFAMFKQLFTYAFRFSYSLEHLKSYYTEYLENRELWRKLYSDRLIEVSYESLVTDTDACLQEVFSKLDLKFDPNAWSSERDNLHSMTASSIQVTQDVSADSVGKWKAYRDNLSPLLDLIEH